MKLSQAFLSARREELAGSTLLAEKRDGLRAIRVTAVGVNVEAGEGAFVHAWWVDLDLGRRPIRLPLTNMNKVLGEYVKQCDLRALIGESTTTSSSELARRGKALRAALLDLLSSDRTPLVERLSNDARSLQRRAVLDFVSTSAHSELVTEEEVKNLRELLARLRRTEDRIHGLVKFIAEGDDSKYVRETLRDLEAQARIDTAAIEHLQRELKSPVRLPTPDALVERAHDLDTVLAADPVRAREAPRGAFENGRIEMHPGEDGTYTARATFLPLAAVVAGDLAARAGDAPVTVPFEVTVPRPPDRRRKA